MAVKNAPPKESKRKSGFLGEKDREYIRRHVRTKSAEVIADDLRRIPKQIIEFIETEGLLRRNEAATARATKSDLDEMPKWRQVRDLLDEEEIHLFRKQYIRLVDQFGEAELQATEIDQIFNYILCDIQLSQTSVERKLLIDRQKDLKREIDGARTEQKKEGVSATRRKTLEAEIRAAYDALNEVSRSLSDIDKRLDTARKQNDATLKALKGTREQRVKLVTDANANWMGFIRALQDDDFRDGAGDEAGMMRIATDKCQSNLVAEIRYENGEYDRPMLLPETTEEEGADGDN